MTYPHPADPTPSDNPHPPPPIPQPLSRAVRFAIAAGPLTAVLLARRAAEAQRCGKHLLEVCTEAELLHLHFIQRAMPLGSGWEDAIAAIRAVGRS